MSNTRVRYGRVEHNRRWVQRGMDDGGGRWVSERVPKNTLVTVRNGDLVYFGIARCHSRLDTFKKTLGTKIATERCNLAVEEFGDVTTENFTLHASGLRGVVRLDSIQALLRYFDNIDNSMLASYQRTEEVVEAA